MTPARLSNLTWYLVEFTNNTAVQHSSEDFAAGDGQEDVTLSSTVNLESSIALGGMYMRGGKSTHDSDDNPGYGWFTYDLTSNNNLRITRNVSAGATADADWFVIDFEASGGSSGEADNLLGGQPELYGWRWDHRHQHESPLTDDAVQQPPITAATDNNIRIRIPGGFKLPMVWDNGDVPTCHYRLDPDSDLWMTPRSTRSATKDSTQDAGDQSLPPILMPTMRQKLRCVSRWLI